MNPAQAPSSQQPLCHPTSDEARRDCRLSDSRMSEREITPRKAETQTRNGDTGRIGTATPRPAQRIEAGAGASKRRARNPVLARPLQLLVSSAEIPPWQLSRGTHRGLRSATHLGRCRPPTIRVSASHRAHNRALPASAHRIPFAFTHLKAKTLLDALNERPLQKSKCEERTRNLACPALLQEIDDRTRTRRWPIPRRPPPSSQIPSAAERRGCSLNLRAPARRLRATLAIASVVCPRIPAAAGRAHAARGRNRHSS